MCKGFISVGFANLWPCGGSRARIFGIQNGCTYQLGCQKHNLNYLTNLDHLCTIYSKIDASPLISSFTVSSLYRAPILWPSHCWTGHALVPARALHMGLENAQWHVRHLGTRGIGRGHHTLTGLTNRIHGTHACKQASARVACFKTCSAKSTYVRGPIILSICNVMGWLCPRLSAPSAHALNLPLKVVKSRNWGLY